MASFNNSSRFPFNCLVSLATPVMFPPGRAMLSTIPVSTETLLDTITTGIVVRNFLIARNEVRVCRTSTSGLICRSFRNEIWNLILLTLDIPILYLDTPALNTT